LNVLSDCPVGWGHEPREFKRILDAAVETRFWPLYEVVDGGYRLTYDVAERRPIEEFLRGQKRFAHLLEPENADLLTHIQRHIDEEWEALLAHCREYSWRAITMFEEAATR
jgi:pyruvate ferredoxin oxidoreductase beta subunit